jgi:hypothetical protein
MNCGELVEQILRVWGVDAIYGQRLDGVRVREVREPSMASLLALAHEKVHHRSAMVHLGGGVLARPAQGDSSEELVLDSPDALVGLAKSMGDFSRLAVLRLELDLETPVEGTAPYPPPLTTAWESGDRGIMERIQACARPVILAGPRVVTTGAHATLNAVAIGLSAGVLNTWGAKGVFHWRSRHHLATAGLQAFDFELGGLPDADLIVATGVDPDEAPESLWQLAPFVVVAPTELGQLAEQVNRAHQDIRMPPLRAGLAEVTQDGWLRSAGPLAPTRATLHYSQSLGEAGYVAADAGVAGYWVARTFSTTQLGAVSVPATPVPGLAVASVVVARLARPYRRALAVVDAPLDGATEAMLKTAAELGIGVGVEVWDPEGPVIDAESHLARVHRLALERSQTVVHLNTEQGQMERMIDVAGPVIAWPELRRGPKFGRA